nr:MAG TPA: PGDYG protein [Caudoviricetes sp.]DAQ54442.1 MAG TPA: PGDYG protein [Caudoviricetes sp.]
MSKRYVKKVSEIQAIQYNGNNAMEVVEFVEDVVGCYWFEKSSLEITTENEVIACSIGDYIVKDHKGKIKVYKANEFEKNYSEVEDD